jgi:DNA-binding transcriptional LysR family regulator
VTGRPYRGAAEECAVSQPALSMQIHELENELGAKLIVPQQWQPPRQLRSGTTR